MFLPTFLSLSVLALLQLGATQEFVLLTRNQLREEIRAGITAALSSWNQSPSPLNLLRNSSCTCDRLNDTLQEAVGRLQQQVNTSTTQSSECICKLSSVPKLHVDRSSSETLRPPPLIYWAPSRLQAAQSSGPLSLSVLLHTSSRPAALS